MVAIVVCKNKEDSLKMKALVCSHYFFHYSSMGIFPDTQGQLTPQSQPVQAFTVVLVNCKNEEDPIKNGGARASAHIITIWELSVAMETRVLV